MFDTLDLLLIISKLLQVIQSPWHTKYNRVCNISEEEAPLSITDYSHDSSQSAFNFLEVSLAFIEYESLHLLTYKSEETIQ